jgi:uncharacterized protein YidB (DUF937 family)
MSKGLKIALAAGGVIMALLIAGVAVTGFALAQDPDPDQPGNEAFPGRRMDGPRGRWNADEAPPRFGMPGEMDEAVAEALGMTAEELEAAFAEGKTLPEIAEEQGVDLADVQAAMETARREHLEAMIEEAPPAGWRLLYHDEMEQAVADALNITIEDLETARAEGQRLFEIAEEQGLDPEQVQEALETAREEIVDQAVADGVLTEEQAERMSGFGPGFGGPGGRGGRGGRGRPGRCNGMPRQGFPFGRSR